MEGERARLIAGLALRGISRREAARALHLSESQLNKKLRGQARLYEEERRKLLQLLRPLAIREGSP